MKVQRFESGCNISILPVIFALTFCKIKWKKPGAGCGRASSVLFITTIWNLTVIFTKTVAESMKPCSSFLVTKEVQSQTMRYSFILDKRVGKKNTGTGIVTITIKGYAFLAFCPWECELERIFTLAPKSQSVPTQQIRFEVYILGTRIYVLPWDVCGCRCSWY